MSELFDEEFVTAQVRDNAAAAEAKLAEAEFMTAEENAQVSKLERNDLPGGIRCKLRLPGLQ